MRSLADPFSRRGLHGGRANPVRELHPDTDFELGAEAYEHIKAWVFGALATGKLTQAFDDVGNRIRLKAAQA